MGYTTSVGQLLQRRLSQK